ncbi:hypothetical protein ACWDRR_27245 [Kitasatospora sp. NPDC003701]
MPRGHGADEHLPARRRDHDLTSPWDTGPYYDAEGNPLLAGQRLVRHHLDVSSSDLRRRHRDEEGAHRELADHVDLLARQVDLLDDQIRAKAASIRDRLLPLSCGNHRGVDTNGVLRLGAMDLEVLGIRYAQSLDTLEHTVLAYQRAAPAAPPPDRATAANARGAVHSSPTPAPALASAPSTGEPHHRRDRAAPRH